MKSKDGILKGAVILSLGTFIAKVLGAIYRVPLTAFIGAEGLGIYQMVFPFYCILLTLSSTGIPSALSKLIAEGKNGQKLLYKSIILFGSIGLIGTFIMFILSDKIASMQGNALAGLGYKMLSPSVFLVSVLSCLRGYFQGKGNMSPTAITQIIEQFVKLALALSILRFLPLETYQKAGVCCLAVTLSEVVALFFILVKYAKSRKQSQGEIMSYKGILLTVIPIALSAILIPFSRVWDSFLVVNLLPLESSVATSQYGIYSGAVESLIGVPVAICYGLAVSGVPAIAKDKDRSLVKRLMVYTLILSGVMALIYVIFASPIANILYFRLKPSEKHLLIGLIRVSALSIVLLACMQSLTSALIGLGSLKIPPINLAVGVVCKIIALVVLLPKSQIGIYGLAISDILCYFVATLLDLLYIIRYKKQKNI